MQKLILDMMASADVTEEELHLLMLDDSVPAGAQLC